MKIGNQKNIATVMIVEDDEDHARLISRTLKKSLHSLFEIKRFKNGKEAVNYLKKASSAEISAACPLFILLDIKMPIMNGFEVLEIIKSNPKIKSIPVIMLTTTGVREDAKKAMNLGANDYIVKPVNHAEFLEKINNLGYYWGFVSDIKSAMA